MKRKLLTLSLTTLLLLTGCSTGISKEDYQQKEQELSKLQEEYNSLTTKNEALSQENQELKNEMTKYLDKEAEDLLNNLNYDTINAWATVSFVDPIISSDKEYTTFYCLSQKQYALNKSGVKEIWNDLISSTKTLAYVSGSISCERITIAFLGSHNKVLAEFVLVQKDNSFELDSIIGDLTNVEILLTGLTKQ